MRHSKSRFIESRSEDPDFSGRAYAVRLETAPTGHGGNAVRLETAPTGGHMSPRWGLGVGWFAVSINMSPRWG